MDAEETLGQNLRIADLESTVKRLLEDLQQKQTLLEHFMDIAAKQSQQLSSLSALQDTAVWDPLSCPRPSSCSTPVQRSWAEVVARGKNRPSGETMSLSNRFVALSEDPVPEPGVRSTGVGKQKQRDAARVASASSSRRRLLKEAVYRRSGGSSRPDTTRTPLVSAVPVVEGSSPPAHAVDLQSQSPTLSCTSALPGSSAPPTSCESSPPVSALESSSHPVPAPSVHARPPSDQPAQSCAAPPWPNRSVRRCSWSSSLLYGPDFCIATSTLQTDDFNPRRRADKASVQNMPEAGCSWKRQHNKFIPAPEKPPSC
ncbi:hypothetical protein WMY93_025527 [Mugilogobius chulae]|uniref:Uncharacterized protein n=1 Tax=Mugilogobius chulae TaxID=88201 RepID=A0AAW0MZJ9_9GOBI